MVARNPSSSSHTLIGGFAGAIAHAGFGVVLGTKQERQDAFWEF
jgi:phosphate/sulfate permease